jgi:hypothetical protein
MYENLAPEHFAGSHHVKDDDDDAGPPADGEPHGVVETLPASPPVPTGA